MFRAGLPAYLTSDSHVCVNVWQCQGTCLLATAQLLLQGVLFLAIAKFSGLFQSYSVTCRGTLGVFVSKRFWMDLAQRD